MSRTPTPPSHPPTPPFPCEDLEVRSRTGTRNDEGGVPSCYFPPYRVVCTLGRGGTELREGTWGHPWRKVL